MKFLTLTSAFALVLAAAAVGPAQAKGCIKGAIVGGVAGHMAHHGVLGAAGGCAVGHHMANKKDREAQRQQIIEQRPVGRRSEAAAGYSCTSTQSLIKLASPLARKSRRSATSS